MLLISKQLQRSWLIMEGRSLVNMHANYKLNFARVCGRRRLITLGFECVKVNLDTLGCCCVTPKHFTTNLTKFRYIYIQAYIGVYIYRQHDSASQNFN